MDILIFLDLYKEIPCLLHLLILPKIYHLKNHGNMAIRKFGRTDVPTDRPKL